MRRYAVRFLVAILTFGLGITLSLLLGLFKPQDMRIGQTWNRRACSKEFRYSRPAFVTVNSHPEAPLKLVYRGTSFERPMGSLLVSVENASGKLVSDYMISGEKSWQRSGKTSHNFLDWTFNEALNPGESRLITLPLNSEGMTLSVVRVNFQDGSIWSNPRGSN